jgi:hypothetical protein
MRADNKTNRREWNRGNQGKPSPVAQGVQRYESQAYREDGAFCCGGIISNLPWNLPRGDCDCESTSRAVAQETGDSSGSAGNRRVATLEPSRLPRLAEDIPIGIDGFRLRGCRGDVDVE